MSWDPVITGGLVAGGVGAIEALKLWLRRRNNGHDPQSKVLAGLVEAMREDHAQQRLEHTAYAGALGNLTEATKDLADQVKENTRQLTELRIETAKAVGEK